MIKVRFRLFVFFLLSVCLIALFFITPNIHAEQYNSNKDTRAAKWYQANYGSTPYGRIGYGEQGMEYKITDPLNGSYASYSSTGFGMGLGGIFSGYRGMFGPTAIGSYSPFASVNNPQPASTLGWRTQGATSESIFGSNTNYFAAQPLTIFGLMGGLFGSFGGLGGFLPGFSMWGYPTNGFGLGGWASRYGWW